MNRTPPALSETLSLRLDRAQVALFRFLLEAREGLALFTSLGTDARGREVLLLRFAPGAKPQLLAFLEEIRAEVDAEILPQPAP